jgi:ubiquinone/menaquinone biosynthesis C-methylase UbiE
MKTSPTFWDGVAENYAKRPVEDVPAFERKKAETRSLLRPEYVVLEVGCGTGTLALELAPLVSHIHAVDVSTQMCKIARRKAADAGVDNVTFHADAFDEMETFESGQFDVVCAYSILHLVPDHRATLAKIFRLLKPGGSLVSSTVCLGDSWMPYSLLIGMMRLFGKAPPVHMIKHAQLDEAIREAGFGDVRRPDVGAKKNIAFVLATKPA